jgi:hypothetical protein
MEDLQHTVEAAGLQGQGMLYDLYLQDLAGDFTRTFPDRCASAASWLGSPCSEREGRGYLVGSHGRWKGPLPSNSPHGHMILRENLVGSHGRLKRPCLQ